MIMVDFSYNAETLTAMNDECRSMLVLDHHKSAGKELEGTIRKQTDRSAMENWMVAIREDSRHASPIGIFDMDRSGARLAWDVLFYSMTAPALVEYVEDRDLWRHELPDTQAINQYIMSFDQTFQNWSRMDAALNEDRSKAIAQGEAILRQKNLDMESVVLEARRRMTLFGYDVPVVNAPHYMASDIARKLFDGSPFVAIYYDLADGRKFSLRAPDESSVDVSELASTFDNGGGHAKAAGFTAPAGWEG
ncbi:phosphohydrolase (DHH superfamily) [Salipiger mucosus DSM 16094]|uniref:Phosphohydrolase (DHH superfamily) n=1 Tax=Salipiger mucosus DSM 16094 TaxID=1123237 RepID=S9QVU3_9RHOB|nr:phosphohydrolase (DHH superfamily) [Salipiger mucosus DSM 16094]